jgi:hypothetical protein
MSVKITKSFILSHGSLLLMEPEEQERQIKKDLQNLTRTLTGDNLNPDEMFSQKRGIRACTPPFRSAHETGHSVSERLKRVQIPG